VARAVRVKARVVECDEREAGARKTLNLGHTIGHALEAATAYGRFLHGEAVAWGLRGVASVARRRGLLSAPSWTRMGRALDALGPLPPIADIDPELILSHLAHDKKRDDLGVAWVLPTDHGVLLDHRIGADEVRRIIVELQKGPPSPSP
jgi:3-dehydroquinate synthase